MGLSWEQLLPGKPPKGSIHGAVATHMSGWGVLPPAEPPAAYIFPSMMATAGEESGMGSTPTFSHALAPGLSTMMSASCCFDAPGAVVCPPAM